MAFPYIGISALSAVSDDNVYYRPIIYISASYATGFDGRRDFDITEIDITQSAITEFDITDTAITESDITESAITRKGKLL